MKKVLFILLTTVFSSSVLLAQQQPVVVTKKDTGWHKIGDAKVDFKSDKDQFRIMGADRFTSIKVKVADAPVRIDHLQIHYEGDTNESVTIAAVINPGSESNVFTLKNNSAELKKVVFVYQTVPNSNANKAVIELWGHK